MKETYWQWERRMQAQGATRFQSMQDERGTTGAVAFNRGNEMVGKWTKPPLSNDPSKPQTTSP